MTPGKTHHDMSVVRVASVASVASAVGAMTAKPSRAASVKTCTMPRQRTLLPSLTATPSKLIKAIRAIPIIQKGKPICSASHANLASAAAATATAVNAANEAMHHQTVKTAALRMQTVPQLISAISAISTPYSKVC